MKTIKLKKHSGFNFRFFTVLMLIMILLSVKLQAQNIFCYGDSVDLVLTGYLAGDIQWQQSLGGKNFTDMSGKTGTTLSLILKNTYYYRASVKEGTCAPYYSDTIKLTVHPKLTANAGKDTFMCKGSVMTLGGSPTVTGGQAPYQYQWSPNIDINNPNLAMPTSWTGITRKYTLEVTDANGCSAFDSMVLNVGELPAADAGLDKFMCYGNNSVIGGNPSGTGGTPPYSYSWIPTTDLDNPKSGNPQSTTLTTRVYQLTVKDSFGCKDNDNMILTVNPRLYVNAGIDTGVCTGKSMPIGGSPTVLGGTPPYSYSWSPGNVLNDSTLQNPTVNTTTTTNFLLTITDYNGCTATDGVGVTINPAINVDAGNNVTICQGTSTNLNTSVTGGTPTYFYQWSPTTKKGADKWQSKHLRNRDRLTHHSSPNVSFGENLKTLSVGLMPSS